MSEDEVSTRETTSTGKWALSVLIAEDNPQTAQALAHFLELQGHVALLAAEGNSALEKARTACPDVILLDIGLPGMDGWQVVERLREQAAPKRPLIIAVTGHGEETARLRSAAVGIDLHLIKPVNFDELSRLLQRFRRILAPN